MLLFLDGLDTINSATIISNKWDYATASSAPTLSTTLGRTGKTCLAGNEASGQLARYYINSLCKTIPRSGVASALFASASYYPLTIDVSLNSLFNPVIVLLSKNICSDLSASLTGRTGLLVTFQNDTQTLQLEKVIEGVRTILATTAAGIVPLNEWCRIEIRVDIPGDSVEVRANGVAVLTSAADLADHAAGFAQVGFAQYMGRVDDPIIYTGQNTGDGFHDWLGDIIIDTILPSTGAGSFSEWTRSGGTSNAAAVDETPINTTDYVSASTVGLKDTYNYPDMPSSPTTIHAVAVTNHMVTNGGTTRPQVCAVAKTASGELDSAAKAVPSAYTTPVQFGFATKPGGGAWTAADVNAAEFGVKLTAN